MAVISSGNISLDQISSSYQPWDKGKAEEEDALGQEAFLTMLVAQLQNQDPLNPMEGSDFSAQLAQFSQLEQLINLNESMDSFATSFGKTAEGDAMGYIGKQVTGNVNMMRVDQGSVTGGFYELSQPGDVLVTIMDSDGTPVKTMFEGQQNSGSHMISWDGTDNNGNAVTDGSYEYTVMANTGYGYIEVPSMVTGTVEGIAYSDSKPYLVVEGVLLDPASVTSVVDPREDSGSDALDSTVSYLGRTVTSDSPIVLVEDRRVSGEALTFNLPSQKDVTLNIYDGSNELIRTITIPADQTTGGENQVLWDGFSDGGYQVPDGLYYYTARTDAGNSDTPLSEEVSGIKYMNGNQYLVLQETGRLIAVSSITGVN